MKKIADCMMSDLSLVSRLNNRYRRLISDVLPENLMKHIVFVRIDQRAAKITVTSSAFAVRIRFHSRDIQRQLSQDGPINSVTLHVLPAGTVLPAPRPSERENPKASEKTVTGIRQVANSIDAPDLKQSLERLAKNLTRTDR